MSSTNNDNKYEIDRTDQDHQQRPGEGSASPETVSMIAAATASNSTSDAETTSLERDERILNNITSYLIFTDAVLPPPSSSAPSRYHYSAHGPRSTTFTAGAAAYTSAPAGDLTDSSDYGPVASMTTHNVINSSVRGNGGGWAIRTPATPGLISISPLVPGKLSDGVDSGDDYGNYYYEDDDIDYDDQNYFDLSDSSGSRSNDIDMPINSKVGGDHIIKKNINGISSRRDWERSVTIERQRKLAANIFAHQQPLRSYCVDAYEAARDVQQNLQQQQQEQQQNRQQHYTRPNHDESPETLVEPQNDYYSVNGGRNSHNIVRRRRSGGRRHRDDGSFADRDHYDGSNDERNKFVLNVLHHVIDNVPVSVATDVAAGFGSIALDSTWAGIRITSMTMNGIACGLGNVTVGVWDGVTSFNPIAFAHFIITRPFNMMGKTTEVVVSGIQSVATGVGSASSIALHRLSAKPSSGSLISQASGLRRLRSPGVSRKLLKKLSSLNSAATVLSYRELDDTGGLTKQAKSRVQRMMHYDVSLRPFMATVKLEDSFKRSLSTVDGSIDRQNSGAFDGQSSLSSSPIDSPFMCTPQSFPPTPVSRRMVLARGSRHAADVVYLARDQLRVQVSTESDNERTREMAKALTQGKRLAVFDAEDAGGGIDLSCGQHVATKVGNMLYCSTRSMIPILRNCFVYFEMTVLSRQASDLLSQVAMVTLSVGLSTKDMPPNTLTGSWKGSIGLCSTGQVFVAGQWTAPDPTLPSVGDNTTIGVLCCLDDSSAFQTWEGTVVTVQCTFNINGHIVRPPVSNVPADGTGASVTPSGGATQSTGPVPPPCTLPFSVPAEEELYPTLTLHHPGMRVMCRFSSGDILAPSREAIGAPRKVPIFTVDGSIVFDEETD